MQLCNHATGASTGAPRCHILGGKCKGAALGTDWASSCYPHIIWAGTLRSGSSYYTGRLGSGAFDVKVACSSGYCKATLAFSVRCVGGHRLLHTACSCVTSHKVLPVPHGACISTVCVRAPRMTDSQALTPAMRAICGRLPGREDTIGPWFCMIPHPYLTHTLVLLPFRCAVSVDIGCCIQLAAV